jgi:hypothetical protein
VTPNLEIPAYTEYTPELGLHPPASLLLPDLVIHLAHRTAARGCLKWFFFAVCEEETVPIAAQTSLGEFSPVLLVCFCEQRFQDHILTLHIVCSHALGLRAYQLYMGRAFYRRM